MSSFRISPVPRLGQGLLLGVLCAAALFAVGDLEFFQNIERSILDAQFRARGVVFPSPNIVIVEADDSTVENHQWPMPRRIYADLITHLTRAEAKTIAVDVLFNTNSSSPLDDKALVAASRNSGRVIHAVSFDLNTSKSRSKADSILPRFQIPDANGSALSATWGIPAIESLQRGAAGLGHVNAPPDNDGVLRQIPNILRFRGANQSASEIDSAKSTTDAVIYPSLALSAAAHFLGVEPAQIRVNRGEILLPEPQNPTPRNPILSGAAQRIPLDGQGRTWVNWIGPHKSFLTHSFDDVLGGLVPDSQFKGKIVLIGITSAGSLERQATPFSPNQAAVDLQANAINDILMNRPLRAAPGALTLLLLVSFPMLVGALTMRSSAKIGVLCTLVLCATLWGSAFLSLAHFNLVLRVATPLAASLLAWGSAIALRQWQDAAKLRLAEERYALAVRGANDGLWDWNVQSGEIYFAPRWKEMLGLRDDEIAGTLEEWHERIHEDDLPAMKAQIDAHLSGETDHFENRHRIRHRDGHYLWVLSRGLRVCDASGVATRMAGSQSDISAQVEALQQLEYNAYYDSLTGLHNRAFFMQILATTLNRSHKRGVFRFAVLFLDLDRFKTVNDSLGHLRGDELLVGVSQKLAACLRPGDTAARLGGDEFTVLLDNLEHADVAVRVAERIQHELSQPFSVAGQDIFPSSSIGVVIGTASYAEGEDLLRDADIAMYRAKAQGRARYAIFDEAMHAESLAALRLETDLRRALEKQEFLVFYQPIISLKDGQISGFEALVRWNHPERGMISPTEFIPLSEETGLIIALDHFVLREACAQMRAWQELFPNRALSISVNLSSKQFTQTDLVSLIKLTLLDTNLPPQTLKLEITEGVLMNNPESAAATLHQLRALGIRLSIDDFGTGYSSLSYLHRFPLNTLKVDQSFVKRMEPSGEARGEGSEIVQTIVHLARNLNMDVIAEGIETRDQMEQLRDILCEYGQGYYFSRPVPALDAQQLLSSEKCWDMANEPKKTASTAR